MEISIIIFLKYFEKEKNCLFVVLDFFFFFMYNVFLSHSKEFNFARNLQVFFQDSKHVWMVCFILSIYMDGTDQSSKNIVINFT